MKVLAVWLRSASMQRLTSPIAFLALVLCVAASSGVSAQTPVGWWRFDDGSGTTAIDSSGNGHNATLVNGVTWVSGQIGGAISGDGGTQYASIPAIDLSATHAITFTAWINRTYSTSGGHVLFEDSANFNSSTTGFGFFPDGDPGSSCLGIAVGVHGDVGYTINCYAQPSSAGWHHFGVTFDKSQTGTGAISLYLDGALQTATGQPYTATNTNVFGSNPLYLFSRGGTAGLCAGKVDDFRLFNTALTATQIQQIYTQGKASLVSIAVTPPGASVAAGATVQYAANGTYSDGTTQDLTASAAWSSSTQSVATITTAGLATTLAAGNTVVTATSGTISGTATLTVTPAALVSMTVSPANSSLPAGNSAQFTATGTYSNGVIVNLTPSVTWTSSQTAVATISANGLATSIAPGNTTIQATLASITATTTLTVPAPLASIAITPSNATLATNSTLQFTATGTSTDGSKQDLTNTVTWNSTSPGIARISSGGLATGVAAGSTTIQATLSSVNASTGLTVSAVSLQTIQLTPATAQVAAGTTLQLSATGHYSDGSTQDLTTSVTWNITDPTIATITGGGLATGLANGNTTISAVLDSVSNSLALVVTPSGLVGQWGFDDGQGTTAVDSSGHGYNATLFNGVSWVTGQIGGAVSTNGTNQYIQTPSIDLSNTQAVTVAAWVNRTWTGSSVQALMESSSNFNSSTTGFGFFPNDSGDCGVTSAILSGVHGSAGYALNCYAPPSSGAWHHIAMVFDKSQAGSKQVGLYIDAVPQTPVASPYTASNTDKFGNNPIYLFARGGSQVFSSGIMDDLRIYNRALTASEIGQLYSLVAGNGNAALQTITVTPVSVVMNPNGTQQFIATGHYSDGTTKNLSSSVTWTSTNTAVASINANGMATAGAVGSTTIQAASGTISGSASITVAATSQVGKVVQWASGDGGATTEQITYQNENTATGNLILVFAHWDNQAVSATVTDQLGNTYIPIFPPTNSGATAVYQVWYAKNVKGGVPLQVMITFTGKTLSFSLVDVIEYSGLDPSAPLDVFASATGTGTSPNSGKMASTNWKSETIIGLFGFSGYALPYSAGTGFTFEAYDASSMLEDQGVSSLGLYGATATSADSADWGAFVMGFKNATQ